MASADVVQQAGPSQSQPGDSDGDDLEVSPVGVDADGNPLEVQFPADEGVEEVLEVPAYVPEEPAATTEIIEQTTDSSVLPGPDSDTAPGSVFGKDTRSRVRDTKKFPYSAVVSVSSKGQKICSGWLVAADKVVTAGHCLYNFEERRWYPEITVTPGANGKAAPYGTAKQRKRWTDTKWVDNGDVRFDWGVIKLDRPLGKSAGWFGMKTKAAGFDGQKVRIAGYPAGKGNHMWTSGGQIRQTRMYQLCHQIDTTPGNSGSPIYLAGTNQVVAIHTHGKGYGTTRQCPENSNAGTRITDDLYRLIRKLK